MDMGNIGLKDVKYTYIYSVIVFGSWKMHGSLWYLKKHHCVRIENLFLVRLLWILVSVTQECIYGVSKLC